MARPRRTRSTSSPAATSSDEFKCPECGKTFSRAASLGAHRNRAHGVTGASKRRTTRTAPAAKSSGTETGRSRGSARRNTAAATTPRTRPRESNNNIDRDRLLQTLFPNGVPPREDIIRRAGNWLDEAEQLAKL
jgi:uncharacterized C2H2 Zn-finger protein